MENTTNKIDNEFEPVNGYFRKTENANENATNHLEVSFSGRPNANAEENGNSDYYQQTNTCRILQRKLELKVEKAKRSYNQYQDTCSKKSQSSSLIPISRLQIPGYVENQPLVDYKSESDDQEEISFFPMKLKSTKKQELSDTFSIQEITIESEDNNSDDSDTSANLELLPPRLKTNLLDKVLNCFYCVQAVESVILDSRCYLEGGGSAESFLASEDLEVGALIGKLRINGNPDEDLGDINLSLRERDAPVEIVPGSKNIVLAVELDKEGVKGPSSIYVNVICVRRHSTDPSFVIPVNVRVIDVNDNAPQWIGTPYTLTLSEVTVPGTRILQGARAADIDQQGPFSTVEYQVLPGPFSEYVQFLNPLEGTLVLKKPLDYEIMHNFTLKLRAQDQGTPPKFTDTMLRLVITDADDQNPKFLRESYKGELPSDGRPGELKIHPEAIKAVDQDEGICAPIQYSIVQSQDTKFFRIYPNTGAITLLAPIGYSELVNGATLVVKATQIDNPDRYALTTVTLSRPGTHSDMTTLSFVQKRFFMRIREDMLVGNRILALPTNKPGKHLRYYIPDPVQSQNFNVGSLGEVILQKPLDYEQATHHNFMVVATDGVANATTEVSLEVIDVNDWEPRFRETHYEFVVPKSSLRSRAESFDGVMIGKIEAADGDRNDKIELSLRGQHAGLFEIDSSGNLFIRPEMLLNESTIHIVAIATDSGVPPRSTSVPITVTMKGVALAQTSWASSILGMFGVLVGIFVLIILVLTCYIIRSKTKTKSAKSRNRVHSQGAVSSANLMTRPKVHPHNGLPRVKTTAGGNVTLANPIANGHGGSGSSLSAGASTILAASLEREAQRERERERQRERDNYAATVRSIVSRASANGQLYDGEMERHSIAIHETVEHNISENGNKKTAWEPHKSNLLSATEDMGSSENNLTVYF